MRTFLKLTAVVQVLAAILIFMTSVVSAQEDSLPSEKDQTETFEGVLIDRESFLAGKTENVTIDELTKRSGPSVVFGVALKQENGSYKFFPFDGNGQAQSSDVLKNYPSGELVRVIVIGVAAGEGINVVTVTEKLDEKQYAGILVDKKDFDASKGAPADISKDSLQATDKIASGYGLAVKQPDGSYGFFKLDDNSQISASEIIAATKRERNITVIAQGVWNGTLLQASSLIEKAE